jgi:hypothetical protein
MSSITQVETHHRTACHSTDTETLVAPHLQTTTQ